jgi:hypothetical protein
MTFLRRWLDGAGRDVRQALRQVRRASRIGPMIALRAGLIFRRP